MLITHESRSTRPSSDPIDEVRLVGAVHRYWAFWPYYRDQILLSYRAHVDFLVAKYGASDEHDLWKLTFPFVQSWDGLPASDQTAIDDAIYAYWIQFVYPGGVLAHALFGFGTVDPERLANLSDAEMQALPPDPWLGGLCLPDHHQQHDHAVLDDDQHREGSGLWLSDHLVFTLDEAGELLRCGRTKIYRLMADDELVYIKNSGDRLVERQEIMRYLDDHRVDRKGRYRGASRS